MAKKKLANQTFAIVLFREHIEKYNDCFKELSGLKKVPLKEHLNLEGSVFYKNTTTNPPKWKKNLEELAVGPIDIKDNSSNSAIVVLKIRERFVALLFGYGKNLLKEDCIEHDFGLKVALNILDPRKMRSVDVTTIENSLLSSRKQASYSTDQDGFEINTLNDILRGVTGHPSDEEKYSIKVTGKDVLFVSFKLDDFINLKERIELYIDAYKMAEYKKSFGWVDNIKKVRQSSKINKLNSKLEEILEQGDCDNIFLSPSEPIDWSDVSAFKFVGTRKKEKIVENLDLDINDYIHFAKSQKSKKSMVERMKCHHLWAVYNNGYEKSISTIYRAVVAQISIGDSKFILSDNDWYQVDSDFYKSVNDFIAANVHSVELDFPHCPYMYNEGEYNEYVVKNNPSKLCLMDTRLLRVENGPKQIEACDIYSLDKMFIHVKNKKGSSLLSHLFSQGCVSAQCFLEDQNFRSQFFEEVQSAFPDKTFNANERPLIGEYSVVFAIIGTNVDKNITETIPFFSLVNLRMVVNNLNNFGFKTFVCFIQRDKNTE